MAVAVSLLADEDDRKEDHVGERHAATHPHVDFGLLMPVKKFAF